MEMSMQESSLPTLDPALAWTFLSSINAKADKESTRWKFAFACEREGDSLKGASEFISASFSEFLSSGKAKNEDGWGVFLEHKNKYIRLPGYFIVESPVNPMFVDLTAAKFTLDSLSKGGNGDEFPSSERNNVTKLGAAPATILGIEHRAKLEARGLTAETIAEAGITTIPGKKNICELLHRSSWDQGPVCAFPHHLDAGSGHKSLRLVADKPSVGKASSTIQSVWTHGTEPLPYFPMTALRDNRYSSQEPLYWVLDEIDTLVVTQKGHAAVGGEHVDAFFDLAHEAATGEVRLQESITENLIVRGIEHVVLFYRRVQGRKKHDAYRLVAELKRLGAKRCSIVDVAAGDLRGCANDDQVWDRLISTKRIPSEDELQVSYPTLNDALGDGLPSTKLPLLIPKEFDVKENGEIIRFKEVNTPNGPIQVPERVTRNPMFIRRIVEDFTTQERQYEVAFQTSGEWRTRLVPVAQLLSRRELGKLAQHGMHASDHNAPGVVAWFHEFVELNDLNRRFEVTTSYRRTGWHTMADGTKKYIFPGLDGAVFDENDGRKSILDALVVRGDYDVQLDYTKRVMAGGIIPCTAVLTALSSIGLEILEDATNLVTHLFGQTTQGKTATQRVASAFFGDPERMKVKGNTTATGLEYTLATCNGMLTPIDEITSADAKTREEFAYMIYDGKGKTRGAKTGGTKETQAWRACVLSTAEVPFTEDSARAGAQARVLNLKFTGIEGFTKQELNDLYALTAKHHGHLGRRYAIFLMFEVDHDQYRADFAELQVQYAAYANVLGLNVRFALSAALLALNARYGARCFGFDPAYEQLMLQLLSSDQLAKPSSETVGERGLAVLIDHLQSHPAECVSYDDPEVRGTVTARKRGDGHLCLIPERLKKLMTDAGLSSRMVREEWRDKGWIKEADKSRTDKTMRIGDKTQRFIILDGTLLYDNANDPIDKSMAAE